MITRKPITHLRLWSDQQDVTSMFTVEESGGDKLRINGPFELLTHYTVNENLATRCHIDGPKLADSARRADAHGDHFHALLPNYYNVFSY